jgi:hypothetical protein
MLFNILIVVLVVYVMLTPFFIVKAIKFGMQIGSKADELPKSIDSGKLTKRKIKLPKRKTKSEKAREKELERITDILSNIETYDGTSIGQKEIKN